MSRNFCEIKLKNAGGGQNETGLHTFLRGATYDYKTLYLINPPQRLKNFMDP